MFGESVFRSKCLVSVVAGALASLACLNVAWGQSSSGAYSFFRGGELSYVASDCEAELLSERYIEEGTADMFFLVGADNGHRVLKGIFNGDEFGSAFAAEMFSSDKYILLKTTGRSITARGGVRAVDSNFAGRCRVVPYVKIKNWRNPTSTRSRVEGQLNFSCKNESDKEAYKCQVKLEGVLSKRKNCSGLSCGEYLGARGK